MIFVDIAARHIQSEDYGNTENGYLRFWLSPAFTYSDFQGVNLCC